MPACLYGACTVGQPDAQAHKGPLNQVAVILHVGAQLSSCTPSAACDPQYSTSARAVIAIYAINLSLGAMALCTGARLPATATLHACAPAL